jgi:hypothetical protein
MTFVDIKNTFSTIVKIDHGQIDYGENLELFWGGSKLV